LLEEDMERQKIKETTKRGKHGQKREKQFHSGMTCAFIKGKKSVHALFQKGNTFTYTMSPKPSHVFR
jgi:hypothetical protein